MARFKISDFKNRHFLALTGNAVNSLLSIGLIGLLTRSLSIADVGNWFFFLTIYTMGDAVRSGFLSTATIKFYAGTSEERSNEVLGSVWYIALTITGILVLLDAIFIPFIQYIHNQQLIISIWWFGITFISSLPFTLIYWVLLADNKYALLLKLRLVNTVSMILYIIILIALKKMSLEALLWCNLLTNCLTSIIGMAWRLGRLNTIFNRTRTCIREIVGFGKYSLGTTFVSKLFGSADTFIITFLLGPAAFAIWSIALKLMTLVEIPLLSFVGTGMSGMAVAYNNKDMEQTAFIMKKYTGMLTFAFIPLTIMAFLFATPAVYILGGQKYIDTAAPDVYRILMVIALVYPLDRFSGATLDIIHKPNINLIKVIIMLILTVAADLIAIQYFKTLKAVAFVAIVPLLCGTIFGYINLSKYLDVKIKDILSIGFTEIKEFIIKFVRLR